MPPDARPGAVDPDGEAPPGHGAGARADRPRVREEPVGSEGEAYRRAHMDHVLQWEESGVCCEEGAY